MTADEITAVGNALLSEVFRLPIPTIRQVIGAAGIDAGQIPATSEASGGLGSRAEIVPVIQRLFCELPPDRKERALPILAEQVLRNYHGRQRDEAANNLERLLAQHGFRYEDGRFSPINAFDNRERAFLPTSSLEEVADAFARLADGDESGAITKACGAVDRVTQALYAKHIEWGVPPNSFQAKVNTSLKRLNVFKTMEKEFVEP